MAATSSGAATTAIAGSNTAPNSTVAVTTTAAPPTTSATTTGAAATGSTTSQTPSSLAATATGATTSAAKEAASGAPVSFKADVQPILTGNCVSCHGSGKVAGLSLQNYADVLAGGKDGAVVKPGDADGSLLVQKVKGTQTIGARMPRGGPPLPDDQIQTIATWVAQGAKDN